MTNKNNVSGLLDDLIDTAQRLKSLAVDAVQAGVDIGQDLLDTVNDSSDKVIDKAQELKG